jgi:hypothetical protein
VIDLDALSGRTFDAHAPDLSHVRFTAGPGGITVSLT